jgi:hypothetical protein
MRLAAKLGFTEVERFEKYGAEQWDGAWSAEDENSWPVDECDIVPNRMGRVPNSSNS